MISFLNVTIILYTIGLLHSIFGFQQKRRIFQLLALWMVAAGFLSHTIFLLWLIYQTGHFPTMNLSGSLCFFAWCISLAFIIATIRYKITALGAFSLPLVSVLTIISQLFWEENHKIPPLIKSGWISFHAGVAFVSYAAFFLTFISAIFYLIQEKELKGKRFRFLYFRLPPLQTCNELLRRFLFIGFFAMSLTIVTGAFSAQQAWGRFWSWDPKETAALITWTIYFVLINYRLSAQWHGKWAAYISILGFISVLVTFGVNWGLHTFL